MSVNLEVPVVETMINVRGLDFVKKLGTYVENREFFPKSLLPSWIH